MILPIPLHIKRHKSRQHIRYRKSRLAARFLQKITRRLRHLHPCRAVLHDFKRKSRQTRLHHLRMTPVLVDESKDRRARIAPIGPGKVHELLLQRIRSLETRDYTLFHSADFLRILRKSLPLHRIPAHESIQHRIHRASVMLAVLCQTILHRSWHTRNETLRQKRTRRPLLLHPFLHSFHQ